MEYSVLKKVILVSYLLIFCNTNAYASLPDFTDLVKEVAPAVVKINTAVSYTHLTLPTIYSV